MYKFFSCRAQVELIIAGCEAKDSPYEFLIAQATDGSIPFYERMGFVRVGAITVTPREAETERGEEEVILLLVLVLLLLLLLIVMSSSCKR